MLMKYERGVTLNLGDFQSVKLAIGFEGCDSADYDYAVELAEKRLAREILGIKGATPEIAKEKGIAPAVAKVRMREILKPFGLSHVVAE